MIEYRELKQLIAMAEYGTVSAAAEALHTSQPALTRALQRLEAELKVSLFHRKGNRLVLSEIGERAVRDALPLVAAIEEYPIRLKTYAARLTAIPIGSCAPAPMWEIARVLSANNPERTIITEIKPQEILLEGLLDKTYRLVITDRPVTVPGVTCAEYTTERLFLAVTPEHPMAGRESVQLADLEGMTMLVYRDLGIWKQLLDKHTKNVRYIVQSDRSDFFDLRDASNIPCFSTNLTHHTISGRTLIPFSDTEAAVTFYLCVLPENSELVHGLVPDERT